MRIGTSKWLSVSAGSLLALALLPGCGSTSTTDSGSDLSTGTTVSAPSITTQPTSQAIAIGATATFSVVASGGGTLAYQWYKSSTAISGATASSYSISSVTSSDEGSYTVVVSNSAGSVTSSAATLTVSSSSSTACSSSYVASVLSAISTLESAMGSSLTAQMQYDSASYSTSQLNIYKTRWSNLPAGSVSRPGITLSNFSSASEIAAFNTLASTALSGAGYADFQGVLAADDYLGYTRNANGYGADLYHVAVVGTPSSTGLWTLMLGGHHMAFNITFNAGCAYPTPHHIGVEPRTTFTANNATSYDFYNSGSYTVLADKAAAMVAVFSSLGSTELSSAFLTGQKFSDVLIGPVEVNSGSYSTVSAKFSAVASSSNRGLLVSSLTTTQQALVTAAIQQYADDYDTATANRLLADYQEGYDSTYVAWANASGSYSSSGPDVSSNGTYMRIDGPRVWIEIAVQTGVVISSQTHYHTMFRDKTYDYYNELSN